MLVFFTAEWCHFCHQMADEAFTHPQVVTLAQQFVCVLVDADAEPEACKQFRVQAFPTVQFVSARGIPLNRVVGKKPGHQLMMAMQAALQSVARRTSSVRQRSAVLIGVPPTGSSKLATPDCRYANRVAGLSCSDGCGHGWRHFILGLERLQKVDYLLHRKSSLTIVSRYPRKSDR